MNLKITAPSSTRELPHAREAEIALLTSILIDADAILDLTLQPCDFYTESHAAIYAAMLALLNQNKPIDLLTIETELTERGKLDFIGGIDYLYALQDNAIASLNPQAYAQEIERAALKRKLLLAASNIADIAYDSHGLTDAEMQSKAHQELLNVEARPTSQDGVSLYTAIGEFIPELQDYFSGTRETWGVPTGFADLDAVLGGLPYGEMTLIAADPGKGKTTLATDLLLNAATRGYAGVFFSLEMRRSQILLRVLAHHAGVETSAVRRNRVTRADKDKIFDEGARLEKLPVWIYDAPMDTLAVHRAILKIQRRETLSLAVIDYSDLLKDHAESEVVRMKNISHALKNIAKQTNVALVVVHPITRESSQQDELPQLHHLGWGRAWEYDPHTVIFPFFSNNRKDFSALIKIGKFRDGISGKAIDMVFDGKSWKGLAR